VEGEEVLSTGVRSRGPVREQKDEIRLNSVCGGLGISN
jgi:hypothetical protein